MPGMTAEDKRGPGLKFPPPLLAAGAIGCIWLADRLKPLPIVEGASLWMIGAAIIALALVIMLVALLHFFEAKTQVEPWHPTTEIISKGVYRFSRNPIYLGFCIATIGAGLILNSWWMIASVVVLKSLLERLVIHREEIYLENKFGDRYLEYKTQVRRWL
ncbi:MAG: isoprenylcysteine carboxylmethyltransferase family protein [Gammaproteobacteria bacterium]|nr:isoprenylcysteine carboxylmethyltransferase family protein [Gammaproteobacteria bacterium]